MAKDRKSITDEYDMSDLSEKKDATSQKTPTVTPKKQTTDEQLYAHDLDRALENTVLNKDAGHRFIKMGPISEAQYTPHEYSVIENHNQRFVIFRVTKDQAHAQYHMPTISDVLTQYRKKFFYEKDTTLLFPVIQTKKGHIVLAEINLEANKITIHDSQSSASAFFFKGALIDACTAMRFPVPTYNPYNKQQSDYECGYYVYEYIQDIIYNAGNNLAKLVVDTPNKKNFLAKLNIEWDSDENPLWKMDQIRIFKDKNKSSSNI